MKYKAVIFDLDGTLLDTLEDMADIMNDILETLGYPTHRSEDYRQFLGKGTISLVAQALPETARNYRTIKECAEKLGHVDEYNKDWIRKSRPFPGVTKLLNGLKNRQILMNILSNKSDNLVAMMAKKLLRAWKFENVIGSGTTLADKPNPDGAIAITKNLGIKPDEFIYLGDTAIDMETATAAGMFPIGALWGYQTRIKLVIHGAKETIESPEELLDYL